MLVEENDPRPEDKITAEDKRYFKIEECINEWSEEDAKRTGNEIARFGAENGGGI